MTTRRKKEKEEREKILTYLGTKARKPVRLRDVAKSLNIQKRGLKRLGQTLDILRH